MSVKSNNSRFGLVWLCILFLSLALTAGCTSQTSSPSTASVTTNAVQTPNTTTSSAATVDPVQIYADPATESMLLGMQENSFEKYTQYFNTDMKKAVTAEIFEKSSQQIKTQVGDYVSKKFLSTEIKGEYVIVHYEVQYTRGVLKIRMVFDKDHSVAGQWYE